MSWAQIWERMIALFSLVLSVMYALVNEIANQVQEINGREP